MNVQAKSGLQTFPDLRSAETGLLRESGASAVAWCGRGATALYWAYRMAAHGRSAADKREVILPAISCVVPADVALMAGLEPRFADVDSRTGLVALDSVKARWTPRTCAVVFVHLFGQTSDLRPLAEWCRSKGVALIEDAALALGARLPDGRPVGSAGDMTVYSFGRKKILECGGGALAVRSRELAHALEDELATHPLPPEPDAETCSMLELSDRNLQYALIALLRSRALSDASEMFLRVRAAYQRIYLRPMTHAAELASAWPLLPALLARRRRKADVYAAELAVGPWQLLTGWQDSGVCWRYSLLLHDAERVVSVSEAVRRDGFHVSNLYWPVNQFLRPDDACPDAEGFARRVVNLWVDDSVDTDWAGRCAASVRKHAHQ